MPFNEFQDHLRMSRYGACSQITVVIVRWKLNARKLDTIIIFADPMIPIE